MALLSIVIPVHGVEAYLRECLDSIVAQPLAGVEVVAVDDRSPDRCGEILDEYAQRVPALQVLHLSENRGLGGARDAGLAVASGTFVWFVDADDWLDPTAIEVVTERLRALDPDLLLVGNAVEHRDGAIELPERTRALATLPPQVQLREHPELPRDYPNMWCWVVRRALMASLGLAHPRGIYEDIPVTVPLMAAAGPIGVVAHPCLTYRQRPGSILATAGRRHFDLLDQWALTVDRVEALGPAGAAAAPAVHAAMAHHLFSLLGSGRIEPADRQEWFERSSALVRARRPPGFVEPRGTAGLRYRLLHLGRWSLVRGPQRAYWAATALRARLARATGLLSWPARALRDPRRALARLAYRAALLRPVDPHLALYCAYWGTGYSCNPRAVYEQARRLAPEVRGVWVATPELARRLPVGVDHVIYESPAYFRALARASYLVSNVSLGNYLVRRPGTTYLQTQHGTPLKAMGVDVPRLGMSEAERRRDLDRQLVRTRAWDYVLSSNPHSTATWPRAFPASYSILEYGYPRNDVLASATPTTIAEARARLGVPADRRTVLYMPTFREGEDTFALLLDPEALAEAIGDDVLVLVRAHHVFGQRRAVDTASEAVMDVSAHPCVEELYLASDALITDYSSAMFDYAVLDRPIAIYAPDWDHYQQTRGTYFDLREGPPGVFATDADELMAAFRSGAVGGPEAAARRQAFRERFCALEDGHAAARVVRALMLGQPATDRRTVAADEIDPAVAAT